MNKRNSARVLVLGLVLVLVAALFLAIGVTGCRVLFPHDTSSHVAKELRPNVDAEDLDPYSPYDWWQEQDSP